MVINNPFRRVKSHHFSLIFFQPRLFLRITLLMVLALSMSACVTFNDPEASQEYNTDSVGTLDASTTVGQTFVSRRPLLNGITIWYSPASGQNDEPADAPSNYITAKLYNSPEDASPVLTTTIISPGLGDSIPITIQLPDLNNAAGKPYYLQLIKMSGSATINGRNEDAYPHGQAYLNGQAINSDIAFRLSYDYDFIAFTQDVMHGLTYFWLIFPALTILWLPGWLLLEFTHLRKRFDFGGQTAISIGISLSLIPLIMLWTTILKVSWTRRGILFLAGFLVALFFIRLIYRYIIFRRVAVQRDDLHSTELLPSSGDRLILQPVISFLLIMIFLFSLAVRLIMIRDLATPAWVDSVHHALITRLILSFGSYPPTYLPYFDIPPTAYHPGFHSIAAAFTWLTNLNLSQALLILGQILNALTVFPVYLLAKTLTRNSIASIFAAIIAAFLTPMPAYYTSWGRYTELSGLLILPLIIALVQSIKDRGSKKQEHWIILLGAITIGGLFMVHYRVMAFMICLIVAYLLFLLFEKNNHSTIKFIHILRPVFIMAVAGIISVFPWLLQTIKTTVLPIINSSTASTTIFFQDFSWAYLTSALGKQTLVFALLGLAWGMIKRLRFTYILLVWTILLFLIANFDALHLPGGGLINNTSVEIMLFIPLSILGGYFLDRIIDNWRILLPKQLRFLFFGTIFILIGFVAFSGARQLVTIINPITIISRQADLAAINWINENIPQDETIVINPFAWGYGLYAGNDGGYWISPLSGRTTLPPPVLYILSSNNEAISAQSQQVNDISADSDVFHEFLSSNQINYIYIGAKGGVLSPSKLVDSGLFTILYQKDGVWILELKP